MGRRRGRQAGVRNNEYIGMYGKKYRRIKVMWKKIRKKWWNSIRG